MSSGGYVQVGWVCPAVGMSKGVGCPGGMSKGWVGMSKGWVGMSKGWMGTSRGGYVWGISSPPPTDTQWRPYRCLHSSRSNVKRVVRH